MKRNYVFEDESMSSFNLNYLFIYLYLNVCYRNFYEYRKVEKIGL